MGTPQAGVFDFVRHLKAPHGLSVVLALGVAFVAIGAVFLLIGEEAYAAVSQNAVEALLEPGDALFFPADWAHHIESRGDLSVALSLREVDGALVGT